MNRRQLLTALSAACLLAFGGAGATHAQTVTVGVSVSSTGPAASLGIAQKNSIDLLPRTLGGLPVKYVVLDDASDPSQAGKNARRLVDSDKVDAMIASTTVPTSLAVAEVANETRTPQIALAPFAPKAIEWVFPLPQSVGVMSEAIFESMRDKGVKTLGFIGFSDAYGESWLKDAEERAAANGIKLVASERYARTDQSVTAQALKLNAAKPDAILIAGSGTPAALPMRALRERGFKGQLYQTHGAANNDFLRVAGNAEGLILPTGLVLVAEQLPEDHPSKAVALGYLQAYEGKHGAGSRNPFGAYAHDAYLLLDRAVEMVGKQATPGTAEFRAALRDALEKSANLPLTHGLNTMSPTDHSGFGANARTLITIDRNSWQLLK